MKKLNKKIQQRTETIEAYGFCTYCSCRCVSQESWNSANSRANINDRYEIS